MTKNQHKAARARRQTQKKSGLRGEVKALIVVGAVLLIGAAVLLLSRPGEPDSAPVQAEVDLLVTPDSYTLGSPDAPVTLVEFLDPECEACRAMHPIVKRVLDEYGDDVYFVVRYMPLHRNSVLAARALEAAGQQGKYWEMLDLLFEKQPEWGEQQTPQSALFRQYAASLGLDMAAFDAGLADTTVDAKVQRDMDDGLEAGVKGTPTFFINGTLAGTGMSFADFSSKIEAALK